MESWMGRYAADYSALDFDVEKHREAFRAFAALDIDPRSVPAALTAREQVVHVFPDATFQIGCGDDLARREADERARGCLGFVMLHRSADLAAADRVAMDLRRYFSRHFPGRHRLPSADAAPAPGRPSHVFAAFFPRTEE